METRSDLDRRIRLAMIAVLAAVAGLHLVAIFTANIDWDEFALLDRAVRTVESGEVMGGGRPGLGTLVLLPLAEACENAIQTLRRARILWLVWVIGGIVAFARLLHAVVPRGPHHVLAVATGVGLWVLAPPFLRYSLQVRTDQPAVFFGLWGAVAFAASRRSWPWAIAAGGLFAVGFLFSQKLVYVAALGILLVGGAQLLDRDLSFEREAKRAVGGVLAFALTLSAYTALVAQPGASPDLLPISGAMSTFDFYREFVGFRVYWTMIPTLVPQILVLLALPAATVLWAVRRQGGGPRLALAWAVAALGLAVFVFHAGRFPYFWITLGLFVGTIGALTTGPVLDRLPGRRPARVFLGGVWVLLAASGLLSSAILTIDTQEEQRASLEFIRRAFRPGIDGFSDRGELACRNQPERAPVSFAEQLVRRFGPLAADPEAAGDTLIARFREREVAFMLPSQLDFAYPPHVQDFWERSYVRYHRSVWVSGRSVGGEAGGSGTFEPVAPGAYRWRPEEPGSGPLAVDSVLVEPQETVRLEAGRPYRLSLPSGGRGMLVLDLPLPPAPSLRPFYPAAVRRWRFSTPQP